MKLRSRLVLLGFLGVAALGIAQGVRESVRVGLVWVRLEVRGRDGKPLQDLKASEVKLTVDGKPVAIEGLDRIEGPPAASPPASPIAAAPAVSAPQAAPVAAPAAAASDADLYLAILVDETSTNQLDRRDVYRQIDGFLREKVAAGSHLMLQRFDGRLTIECPWTTDSKRVLDASRKMSKRMFDPRMPSPATIGDELRRGSKPRDLEQQIDLAGRRSFDGIMLALVEFPDVPGRKALVVVSDGTPFISPYDLALMLTGQNAMTNDSNSARARGIVQAQQDDQVKQLQAALEEQSLTNMAVFSISTEASWSRRMAAITRKALELDVAFYPLDPEAIDRGTNPDSSSKWPGRSMPGLSGGAALPASTSGMTARTSVAQSMQSLAESSGGQAILVPHQLSDRLEGMAADRTTGYVLTFKDPAPGDFRFHRIEVSVERPGIKLAYRRGYRIRTDEERTLDAVIANLNRSEAENPLQAKLTFEPLREEGGRHIVAMKLEYPRPPEAPAAAAPEREIQVWAICSDNDGNRAKPIVRKAQARSVSDGGGGPYLDTMQLGLPHGPYTWSVAVKDVPSGLTSYLVVRKDL